MIKFQFGTEEYNNHGILEYIIAHLLIEQAENKKNKNLKDMIRKFCLIDIYRILNSQMSKHTIFKVTKNIYKN